MTLLNEETQKADSASDAEEATTPEVTPPETPEATSEEAAPIEEPVETEAAVEESADAPEASEETPSEPDATDASADEAPAEEPPAEASEVEETAEVAESPEGTAAPEADEPEEDTSPRSESPSPLRLLDSSKDPFSMDEEMDVSREEFEQLLNEHQDTIGEFREGEIVKAKVLRTTDASVILEFGFKSEGSVPLDEFKDPAEIEPGQEVDVLLESLEDRIRGRLRFPPRQRPSPDRALR